MELPAEQACLRRSSALPCAACRLEGESGHKNDSYIIWNERAVEGIGGVVVDTDTQDRLHGAPASWITSERQCGRRLVYQPSCLAGQQVHELLHCLEVHALSTVHSQLGGLHGITREVPGEELEGGGLIGRGTRGEGSMNL